MTHEDAVKNQAVDRYLLDELTPAEREQFEQHYFDCAECAAEVRAGAIFASNARAVFAEQAGRPVPHRPTALSWISGLLGWPKPAAAFALAFGVILLVTNVVLALRIAHMDSPQAYPAFFLHGVARGQEQILRAPRSARLFGVSLDVPPDRAFPAYRCTLEDAAGHPKLTVDAPAASEPGAPLNLLFPAAGLEPGSYTLTLDGVRNGSSTSLGRYTFVLQFQ